jgi:hypothetical protein
MAAWCSTAAIESSSWGSGDGKEEGVGEQEHEQEDGEADADDAVGGTVRLPVVGGTTWLAGPEGLADWATMDSDAAVTSWVKLAGPLAAVVFGLSCFVDHCRRCW